VASFLYRIDVGPRAMLATGIVGGIFWQFLAFAIYPGIRMAGYTWDQFYKEARKEYYKEANGKVKFFRELEETGDFFRPWKKQQLWAQRKIAEEQRLEELRQMSTDAISTPTLPTAAAPVTSTEVKKTTEPTAAKPEAPTEKKTTEPEKKS